MKKFFEKLNNNKFFILRLLVLGQMYNCKSNVVFIKQIGKRGLRNSWAKVIINLDGFENVRLD